jgi:hypothetical protein
MPPATISTILRAVILPGYVLDDYVVGLLWRAHKPFQSLIIESLRQMRVWLRPGFGHHSITPYLSFMPQLLRIHTLEFAMGNWITVTVVPFSGTHRMTHILQYLPATVTHITLPPELYDDCVGIFIRDTPQVTVRMGKFNNIHSTPYFDHPGRTQAMNQLLSTPHIIANNRKVTLFYHLELESLLEVRKLMEGGSLDNNTINWMTEHWFPCVRSVKLSHTTARASGLMAAFNAEVQQLMPTTPWGWLQFERWVYGTFHHLTEVIDGITHVIPATVTRYSQTEVRIPDVVSSFNNVHSSLLHLNLTVCSDTIMIMLLSLPSTLQSLTLTLANMFWMGNLLSGLKHLPHSLPYLSVLLGRDCANIPWTLDLVHALPASLTAFTTMTFPNYYELWRALPRTLTAIDLQPHQYPPGRSPWRPPTSVYQGLPTTMLDLGEVVWVRPNIIMSSQQPCLTRDILSNFRCLTALTITLTSNRLIVPECCDIFPDSIRRLSLTLSYYNNKRDQLHYMFFPRDLEYLRITGNCTAIHPQCWQPWPTRLKEIQFDSLALLSLPEQWPHTLQLLNFHGSGGGDGKRITRGILPLGLLTTIPNYYTSVYAIPRFAVVIVDGFSHKHFHG